MVDTILLVCIFCTWVVVMVSIGSTVSRYRGFRFSDFLYSEKPKYTTIDLRELGEDGVILIGMDYDYISAKKALKLHDSLSAAMSKAKEKGDCIIRVPLNCCNVKIIKNKPTSVNAQC